MIKKKIVIIGGGAAGFFCAANLDQTQYDVCILEQNAEVLQKVKISGGGRCNVTHACFDPRELVSYYPRGNKELRSVFSKFQPGDTMNWFEERGVALKIESDQRVFPESNSSQSIIQALYNEVNKKNFVVKCKTAVKNIRIENNKYVIDTNQSEEYADIIIYTTGSSPKSLLILEKLGHTLISAIPSLFTFNIENELLMGIPGTSFKDAEVTIPKFQTSESGPLMITHWGLSGPAILKLSAWQAINLANCGYKFEIMVNFLGVSTEHAEEILINYKQQNPKKTIGQSKIFEVTQRFWSKILEINRIDPDKQVAQLNNKEVKTITSSLTQNKMWVNGKSTFKEEFVTAGGVDLKEINFKNMASKIIDNFYIAGEVLNIDAVTGGFNFQACWSEAWLIAQHLNKNEAD